MNYNSVFVLPMKRTCLSKNYSTQLNPRLKSVSYLKILNLNKHQTRKLDHSQYFYEYWDSVQRHVGL